MVIVSQQWKTNSFPTTMPASSSPDYKEGLNSVTELFYSLTFLTAIDILSPYTSSSLILNAHPPGTRFQTMLNNNHTSSFYPCWGKKSFAQLLAKGINKWGETTQKSVWLEVTFLIDSLNFKSDSERLWKVS